MWPIPAVWRVRRPVTGAVAGWADPVRVLGGCLWARALCRVVCVGGFGVLVRRGGLLPGGVWTGGIGGVRSV